MSNSSSNSNTEFPIVEQNVLIGSPPFSNVTTLIPTSLLNDNVDSNDLLRNAHVFVPDSTQNSNFVLDEIFESNNLILDANVENSDNSNMYKYRSF